MDDALHAVDGGFHLFEVGQVRLDEPFAGAEIGRRLDVAQPELGVDRPEQPAQALSHVARGTRQQYALHFLGPSATRLASFAAGSDSSLSGI